MKATYYTDTDLLYIKFGESDDQGVETAQPEENENIILEFDANGKLAGMEVLWASQNIRDFEAFKAALQPEEKQQMPQDIEL